MRASQEQGLLASVFAAWEHVVRHDIWDESDDEMRRWEDDPGPANIPEHVQMKHNREEFGPTGIPDYVPYLRPFEQFQTTRTQPLSQEPTSQLPAEEEMWDELFWNRRSSVHSVPRSHQ